MEQAREKTARRMVGKRDIGGYPSRSHTENGKGRDRSRLPRAILDQTGGGEKPKSSLYKWGN